MRPFCGVSYAKPEATTPMIAVTFALPSESSEFLRRLGNKSHANRNGINIVRGTIGHRSIEVIHTGVGKKICTERIAKFLENDQFDFLISSGFAGSLNHELQVNDLLVAKNFSTIDLKHASLSNVSIYAANMLTVPALIDSNEERERIAREIFPNPSEARAGIGSLREESRACTKDSRKRTEHRCARHRSR